MAGSASGALQAFHSRYKYQLMASDRPAYQRLGKLLGESGDLPLESQRIMHRLLDLERIGVSITDHCILVPEKSVTAITGIVA